MGEQEAPKIKLSWGAQNSQKKNISKTKLQAFELPTIKKTAFQKQKEEAEARKKKEEEEAARVYAEFVASFDDAKDAPKAFVRAGTMVPKSVYDAEEAAGGSDQAGKGSLYIPKAFVKSGALKPVAEVKRVAEPKQEIRDDRGKKKRNMDAFLEEIMREQDEREDRIRRKHSRLTEGEDDDPDASGASKSNIYDDRGGSFDTGDPTTTNLYVGNINPQVNEDTVCRHFARYGPIASVKIMWPRTQEERERNRNCGFIAFMNRSNAAAALKAMDGFDLQGYPMRVGWGKAVRVPDQPIYTLDKSRPASSGLPFNAQNSTGTTKSTGAFAAVPPPDASSSNHSSQAPRLEVKVVRPVDFDTVRKIHHVVERVIKYGPAFEAFLMHEEKENPEFAFLFMHDHPEHVYYRWRLYSLLQGDTKTRWRTKPFFMFDHGPIWVPPEEPYEDEDNEIDLDLSEDEDDAGRARGTLGQKARQRFEHMLRKLTLSRGDIAKAMSFAFDHLDAANEVIEVLVKSLLIVETPMATKLARLYLLSDILHNSSIPLPNAWKYRAGFEGRLLEVFEHFNQVYRSISSRLKAEQFRRQVNNVLSVWTSWIVFAQPYIDSLAAIFERKVEPAEGIQAPTVPCSTETITVLHPKFSTRPEDEEEDLDGVPIQPTLNQNDADDDIDGVPLVASEYQSSTLGGEVDRGNAMAEEGDEDLDGVPLVRGTHPPRQTPPIPTAHHEDDDGDDMFA